MSLSASEWKLFDKLFKTIHHKLTVKDLMSFMLVMDEFIDIRSKHKPFNSYFTCLGVAELEYDEFKEGIRTHKEHNDIMDEMVQVCQILIRGISDISLDENTSLFELKFRGLKLKYLV